LLGALGVACSAEIPGKSGSEPGSVPGGESSAAVDCSGARDPGNVVMRRLTHSEYDKTVRDLLGDTSSPARVFPSGTNGSTGFDNEGAALSMSPLLFEKYSDSARTLVETFLASDKRSLVITCDLATEGEACADSSLSAFARRAFRRPVTDEEKQRLADLIRVAVVEGESLEMGVALAMRAILTSPKFLYRIEVDPDPRAVTPHALSGHELATRLSYFLWSSTPDDALLSAADAGDLNTLPAISTQVARMLSDAKAQGFVQDFTGQWLGLRALATLTRDATEYASFNDALKSSMETETQLFFGSFLNEDKSVTELLSANYSYVDSALAGLYGLVEVPSSGFAKVSFGDAPRLGLMTQASVLTASAKVNGTSPPKRGKWVLGQLLCSEPPPPPPNIPALVEEAVPTGSVRQKFEEHEKNTGCSGCHALMDPIGFAFENYDAIGAYRTVDDNGFDVDSSGVFPDGRTFSNAVELASDIASDPEFASCLTQRLFVYATGRRDTDADACALSDVLAAASEHGTTLGALVTALAESAPFTERRGEPE
jgi:hypothetical protein